jgi:hypothetical protein
LFYRLLAEAGLGQPSDGRAGRKGQKRGCSPQTTFCDLRAPVALARILAP